MSNDAAKIAFCITVIALFSLVYFLGYVVVNSGLDKAKDRTYITREIDLTACSDYKKNDLLGIYYVDRDCVCSVPKFEPQDTNGLYVDIDDWTPEFNISPNTNR